MYVTSFISDEKEIDYYRAILRFWWDFENYRVDDMADYSNVASAIFESCEQFGYKGSGRKIFAVGNQILLAHNFQDAWKIKASLIKQYVDFVQVKKGNVFNSINSMCSLLLRLSNKIIRGQYLYFARD